MTSNEIASVMRQALEALEWATGCMSFDDYDDMPEATESLENAHKAITSLRAAIASYSQVIATAVAEQHKESSATQEPVAWRTKRNGFWSYHANEVHGVPNEPLYTHPQAKAEQDEVDIRSRLYQRVHELESVLKDIAEYSGAGPSTTDWQGIVKLISDSARSALGEQI